MAESPTITLAFLLKETSDYPTPQMNRHSVAAELLRRTRISATLLNLLSPEALDIDVISTRILASERLICNDLAFTSVWG